MLVVYSAHGSVFVVRGGRVVGNQLAIFFNNGIRLRHGRQQTLRVRVRGIGKNFSRRAGLNQVAFVQDADSVRNIFHHAQIVRDKKIRAFRFVLNVLHEVDDLRLD